MGVIIKYDESGLATNLHDTHNSELCEGRLCDIHGRLGEEPWASWPRIWREDRGMVEMIDENSGIGHPSPAQVQYYNMAYGSRAWAYNTHGCDGGCRGAYDQVPLGVGDARPGR